MKSKDAGAESNRIVMAEDEDAETLRHCAILGVCVYQARTLRNVRLARVLPVSRFRMMLSVGDNF